MWEAPPTVVKVENASLTGGGHQLEAAIANAAREAMEEWTGVPQITSSVYGIRVYHNNSVLTPHVDRMPLVSSAIINVDQDVDEPWFLEAYDHAGVAHNVSMAPGDLVLYESHSVIHGRPFPMKGKYYANIFVHFEPLGPPRDAPSTTNNNDAGHDLSTLLDSRLDLCTGVAKRKSTRLEAEPESHCHGGTQRHESNSLSRQHQSFQVD